ncbi:MAG: MGMT family protein [Acidobacteria bacterium]|nr:MGMT family protein [Acidobacteriota bacterium]MCZ6746935.1 MGMT family protein [Acidobacteriota bacterium]
MSPRKGIRVPSSARVHDDLPTPRSPVYSKVYRLVKRIPQGKVMTYGQIATHLVNRISPRAVGWALHGCPDDVPWQRVVNASGGCSTDRLPDIPTGMQRSFLEDEGVSFRDNGTLDLDIYRWVPRGS